MTNAATKLLWNTRKVQAGEARSIGEWQSIMGRRPVEFRHYAVRPHAKFFAQHQSVAIDHAMVSRIVATGHRVQRPEAGDDHPEPYIQIGLQLDGTSHITSPTHESVLRPGDLGVFSTERPFQVELSDGSSCILLCFPQRYLSLPRSDVHACAGRAIKSDAGLGLLMSRSLQTIGDDVGTLVGRGGARVLNSVVTLTGAMLIRETDHDEHDSDVAMDEINAYIETHLGDRDLSAQKIAEAHFMSLRTLQYHFQRANTTVSRVIRERRLERARRELAELRPDQPIARTVQRWGFASANHFSREFKQAYGMTPGEYRRRQRHTAGKLD